MLWIDLARAETEPLVFSGRPVLAPQSGGEDVVSVNGVEIEGHVERAGQGFLLEGRVRGAAKLRCVRCLAEFDFPFTERLELHLLPSSALPQEEEKRLEMGDLEVRFYDEPKVDLGEVATEQFALTVPMKPLCAQTCRGMCPRCGANLNLGPCSCPETSDDRWAPLLEWRPSE